MSGGHYQYAYCKLDDFISSFRDRANTPERRAFAEHLVKVSKAMYEIEWVDSGDKGPGDENKSILDVIGKETVMAELVSEAKELIKQLKAYT